MHRHVRSLLLIVFLLPLLAFAGDQSDHQLKIQDGKFVLNGHPFQIISGEMHYARIPREYWRARLQMAKAMGLNTISTYVFWNLHEPRPGTYDFSGQLDVAAFIRMAQQEGFYVILRPGPYVCSEWDLGGLPAWLLADSNIILRSTDEKFMTPAERWLKRLGKELAPLQAGNGGPIIAVQVENEYGSFDRDKIYMRRIYDAIRAAGFTKSLLYTADGPNQLADGTLPELPAAVNLGPGYAKKGLETLAKFRPNQPLMIGEWWAGWFDHWGRPHHVTDAEKEARELEWILSNDYSVNIYMFHGGSTWGFMNGANNDSDGYWPDVSSYDYDSALDESGRPSRKYILFRDVIARCTHQKLPPIPNLPPPIAIPKIDLQKTALLSANLPKPIHSASPRPMEPLGQSYGYILYRTRLNGPVNGDLVINEVRDFAMVYLNGKLAGTLDRRLNQKQLHLGSDSPNNDLDILVENTGRINFNKALRTERKGITKDVTLGGKVLAGWEIYPLPMRDLSKLKFGRQILDSPAFYRGTFELASTGDTFLDLGNWSKGTVWVNGYQLGRFWNIGPQQTLYVPGPWLKKGKNEIVVFDLFPQPKATVRGVAAPILSDLRSPHPSLK
jgi:beta-galactosidase